MLFAVYLKVFGEVQNLATSCMDGYNVCIFAYGQTGSGKTYTMEVNKNTQIIECNVKFNSGMCPSLCAIPHRDQTAILGLTKEP